MSLRGDAPFLIAKHTLLLPISFSVPELLLYTGIWKFLLYLQSEYKHTRSTLFFPFRRFSKNAPGEEKKEKRLGELPKKGGEGQTKLIFT